MSSSSLFQDPFQIWRDTLTKLEGGVNDLAGRNMKSEEFSQALHQLFGAWLGTERVVHKSQNTYFKALNLPSRDDIERLADAVQRVEDKLDQMMAAGPHARSEPRPTRTRRPPEPATPSNSDPARS
jgi:hypothetical protein